MYWSVGRLRESADTCRSHGIVKTKGLPMAATHSPTLSWNWSLPSSAQVNPSLQIFTTAISVCLSVPRTLPSNSRLSVRRTTNFVCPLNHVRIRQNESVRRNNETRSRAALFRDFLLTTAKRHRKSKTGGKSRHLVHPCRGNRNLARRRYEHFS